MTPENLDAISVTPRSGTEAFTLRGHGLGVQLLDFWRWSSSDLAGNRLRGLLAEFIVGQALDCTTGCRVEWDAYDLQTPQGLLIEVKSAAYLQSWKQKRLSSVRYSIRPAQGWTAETNEWSPDIKRRADVYIFCLLAHKDQQTLNPLDLDQWEFYCLKTTTLDKRLGAQKTLSHNRLLELDPVRAAYGDLSEAVFRLAGGRTS